jgi:hypothetical protein
MSPKRVEKGLRGLLRFAVISDGARPMSEGLWPQAQLSHQTKNIKIDTDLSNAAVIDSGYYRAWDLETLTQLRESLVALRGWAPS